DIIFGEGISQEGELLDMGTSLGIIEKSGSWYAYGDVQLGQGKENARQFLRDEKNRALKEELRRRIREKLGLEKKKEVLEKAK
ncbi:DNA recombination/repair protein RecA, partial [Candidatus Aerophobetes bacterium]|nr:DNA recombination/repair protein RecA [Candidatus Aerophobetes bacterium]